jgi:hypothetical protein
MCAQQAAFFRGFVISRSRDPSGDLEVGKMKTDRESTKVRKHENE